MKSLNGPPCTTTENCLCTNCLCTNCPDRDSCTSLCTEAERYVSQDEVPWQETPVTYHDGDIFPEGIYGNHVMKVYRQKRNIRKKILPYGFTPGEYAIFVALLAGKTRAEIAKALRVRRQTVRQHIYGIRKKIKSKKNNENGSK